MSKVNECKCKKCQEACAYKPGWFAPGEAEKAAAFMEMPFQEFFAKYLMVDYWEGYGDSDTFVLSPAIPGRNGQMCSVDPRGRCVFFKKGLCTIHAVKPMECRDSLPHDTDSMRDDDLHERVADLWKGYQEDINKVLGRKSERVYD